VPGQQLLIWVAGDNCAIDGASCTLAGINIEIVVVPAVYYVRLMSAKKEARLVFAGGRPRIPEASVRGKLGFVSPGPPELEISVKFEVLKGRGSSAGK